MFEDIVFRDPLPDGCLSALPALGAERIDGDRVVYRFVDDVPIDLDRDFEPSPAAKHGAHRCIAKGVSVYGTLEAAEAALHFMRGKVRGQFVVLWDGRQICEVVLSDGAGAILRTNRGRPSRDGEHWTWWPAHNWERCATMTLCQ